MEKKVKSTKNIHTSFQKYRRELRHLWEEYNLLEYYIPFLHEKIKSKEVEPFEFIPYLSLTNEVRKSTTPKTLSILQQVKIKALKQRVLLNTIALFEDYIGSVAVTVYTDYPKLLLPERNATGDLFFSINTIVNNETRDEMISILIEKKVRSIFYGNPIDIFKNDSLRLGIINKKDSYNAFSDYADLLNTYRNIVSVRNIITHNSGRVDRKFLKENMNSTLNIGNKYNLTSDYLKSCLSTVEWIAAVFTESVIIKKYKNTAQGKLGITLNGLKKRM